MPHRMLLTILTVTLLAKFCDASELKAGVAKVDITDRDAGAVNDPSYVKALVLQKGATVAVIVTVDAVAIGEIGRIGNNYLQNVRSQLHQELGIPPKHIIINASHCHSVIRRDIDVLTVQAVLIAFQNMGPVQIGAGRSQEPNISENRRLRMKDGSEVDMRRAYSMPPDDEVAGVGPIDPEIGLLRIDRISGKPLAVIYNFACHPIMGAPTGGNTAGFPGFASSVIEDAMGDDTLAFFIQGCAGDINPSLYKTVSMPHNGAPLGHQLGQSVVRGWKVTTTIPNGELKINNQVISIPRGTDFLQRVAMIEKEQKQLLQTLKPTDINFKTFLPLLIQHKMSPEFPSHYSQGYLHEQAINRNTLKQLDAANQANLDAYLKNIYIMERLTRLNVNLALLKKHQQTTQDANDKDMDVEISGVRIGDFRLVTFPGELTVEIGLNIKRRASTNFAFVAGYTNGYIYYTPTAMQRNNTGYAQEDCDCLVGPEWQQIFEDKAVEVLNAL